MSFLKHLDINSLPKKQEVEEVTEEKEVAEAPLKEMMGDVMGIIEDGIKSIAQQLASNGMDEDKAMDVISQYLQNRNEILSQGPVSDADEDYDIDYPHERDREGLAEE